MNRSMRVPPWARLVGLALLVVFVFLLVAPAGQAQDADTTGLKPGETVVYRQTIPVNIVFVGFDRDDIAVSDVRAALPAGYTPKVRYPLFYGLPGRNMGLRFDFEYKPIFTDQAFEDAFFGYLASIATPGAPTLFQQLYNGNENNVLDVSGNVGYIDAPSAEQWLMTAGQQQLGINPDRSYTVYYINWYDRPDFQFHVYTKTDSPDPTRATTSAYCARRARWSPGAAATAAPGSMTSRPARTRGAATTTSTTPTWMATARPTTAFR